MKKKPSSPSAFFNPRALIILVLCSGAACSLVNGTSLAILRRQTPEKVSQRTLTFEERVSYQRYRGSLLASPYLAKGASRSQAVARFGDVQRAAGKESHRLRSA